MSATETALGRAIEIALAGGGHPQELLTAVAEADPLLLVLPTEPDTEDDDAVRPLPVPTADCRWLLACTSAGEAAAFARASGLATVRCLPLPGATLLGELAVQPADVGLCLDPASHGLTLPPALLHPPAPESAAARPEDEDQEVSA